MVRRTGFRTQDLGFRDLEPGVRSRSSSFALALLCILFCSSLIPRHSSLLFGQQPQAQQGQPLPGGNAKQVNGLAPGYWPTPGAGLALNLSPGTAFCGNLPARVAYTGGTLTMVASSTNYVYLDPSGSCVPASNTFGFDVGQIPIAVVVTNASTITAVNDVRSFFSPPITLDSTGRSIFKGLNGTYFADQFGNKSTTGIASAISACGASTPCRVVVPGSYPTTETVPGGMAYRSGGSIPLAGTTSPNVQVQDFRYGDWQVAVNPPGNGINNKIWHKWIANVYTGPPLANGVYQGNTTFSPMMNALDGGVLMSNRVYYAKSHSSAINVTGNNFTPEDINNIFTVNQNSPGDSIAGYFINNHRGGWNTQGEEGALGVEIYVLHGNTAYEGTILSGGWLGSTRLTMNTPSHGGGTQGAGRYLIDVTQAYSTGTISAISGPGGPVTFSGSGTYWPVSTVNTTITQAISSPGSQAVTVGSTSGIVANSTVLIVCDGTEPETIIPTAVGSGTITANFYYPRASGAIVAAGGLSGYFLELTADTAPSSLTGGTGIRQVFPVLYSASTTSLEAAVIHQGSFASYASTIDTACAPPGCGYVLYPGAQVTSVQSGGTIANTFTLMPNAVNWTNGDSVEEPLHPAGHATIGTWVNKNWWPNSAVSGPQLIFEGVPGSNASGMGIANLASASLYTGSGVGNLSLPSFAVGVRGPWASGMQFYNYGPAITGLSFMGQRWGSTGVVTPISVRPVSGNADYLKYDESAKSWTLSANSGKGLYYFGDNVSGAGLTVPGHVGSNTSDTQGRVTITSSTSAAVKFSAVFRHPPICTLTPTSDPTSVGAYWVTSTASSFTVNLHKSGTITFNYICMADPN